MPPEHSGLDDVVFMIKGKVIGRGSSAEVFSRATLDEVYEIGHYEPIMPSGTVELVDAEFHPDWFLGPMDVTVSKGEYLPPRKLRSKKKRIVRKWDKKYTFNKETTTYKNCTITDMEEN